MTWIFDNKVTQQFSEKREIFLNRFLPTLPTNLITAVDVGCGLGYFSNYLAQKGYEVTGIDVRPANIAEAQKRYPQIDFQIKNIEDKVFDDFGSFDLTLCVGLLYHLENPFAAVRNLHQLTQQVLIIETMIFPSRKTNARLIDERGFEDQGVNFMALIPSEVSFIRMLYRSGFPYVYQFRELPDHEYFRSTLLRHNRRTMLAASKIKIDSSFLKLAADKPVSPFLSYRFELDAIEKIRVNSAATLRRYIPASLRTTFKKLIQKQEVK